MEKQNGKHNDQTDVSGNEALRVAVDFADYMKKKGWRKIETYCRSIGDDGDGCPQFEHKGIDEIKQEYEMEIRIEARRLLKAKATDR